MWRKVGKIAIAVLGGSAVGTGVADGITIPHETVEVINSLVGSIVMLLALFLRSPKDED